MANEAVIVSLQSGSNPVRFTCANGATIEKGTLLKLGSDPMTVAATSANDDIFMGIAATEKVINDGSTTIGVWVPGSGNVFDLKCGSAGATLGVMVKISGANLICDAADANYEAGLVVGKALETGSASEVITVLV